MTVEDMRRAAREQEERRQKIAKAASDMRARQKYQESVEASRYFAAEREAAQARELDQLAQERAEQAVREMRWQQHLEAKKAREAADHAARVAAILRREQQASAHATRMAALHAQLASEQARLTTSARSTTAVPQFADEAERRAWLDARQAATPSTVQARAGGLSPRLADRIIAQHKLDDAAANKIRAARPGDSFRTTNGSTITVTAAGGASISYQRGGAPTATASVLLNQKKPK